MFTIIKSKIERKYSYLYEQFKIPTVYGLTKKICNTGDFTLGKPLEKFEKISQNIGSKYAIGVNSGTDAIKIALINLKPGDEVITASNTFVATVGAIKKLDIDLSSLMWMKIFVSTQILLKKKLIKKQKLLFQSITLDTCQIWSKSKKFTKI